MPNSSSTPTRDKITVVAGTNIRFNSDTWKPTTPTEKISPSTLSLRKFITILIDCDTGNILGRVITDKVNGNKILENIAGKKIGKIKRGTDGRIIVHSEDNDLFDATKHPNLLYEITTRGQFRNVKYKHKQYPVIGGTSITSNDRHNPEMRTETIDYWQLVRQRRHEKNITVLQGTATEVSDSDTHDEALEKISYWELIGRRRNEATFFVLKDQCTTVNQHQHKSEHLEAVSYQELRRRQRIERKNNANKINSEPSTTSTASSTTEALPSIFEETSNHHHLSFFSGPLSQPESALFDEIRAIEAFESNRNNKEINWDEWLQEDLDDHNEVKQMMKHC